jgi:TonB family protein
MFHTLLESRHTAEWSAVDGAVSFCAHAALVTLALALTADSGVRLKSWDARDPHLMRGALAYVSTPVVSVDRASPSRGGGRAIRRRAARLVAPRVVPTSIREVPAVDLSELVFPDATDFDLDIASMASRPEDFARPGGLSGAIAGALGRGHNGVYWASEVEKVVLPYADNPLPEYPTALLLAHVEGNVDVQFVVDTTGVADPTTLRILRSTHELFARAVRAVLPRMHFVPAEVGGTKVQVRVEQPFRFELR